MSIGVLPSPGSAGKENSENERKRGLYRIDRAMYDSLLEIVRGNCNTPVENRSTIQRSAYMRYYRHRDMLCMENGKLLYDGKIVVPHEAKGCIIQKEVDRSKGSGAKTLFHRLNVKFCGVSERQIQKLLHRSHLHQMLNCKFNNKPPPIPITARSPHERHQIDLLDVGAAMSYQKPSSRGRNKVYSKKQRYRYILTVIDVFSRYVWLRPLAFKSSKLVARALKGIYNAHGHPKIIQCDRGTEFRGCVNNFIKMNNICMVRSSPYHPQSQGKVERCHRMLRRKMAYDVKKSGQHLGSFNWVDKLECYANAMNGDPRKPLGFRTPFEAYYGRVRRDITSPISRQSAQSIPSTSNSTYWRKIRDLRSKVNAASQKADFVMQKHHHGIFETMKIGEKVLVKAKRDLSKRFYRSHVVSGEIINKRGQYHYLIRHQCTTGGKIEMKWYDIADLRKLPCAKSKSGMKAARAKFYIPLEPSDSNFELCNFRIGLNPIGDGSCQFSAVCDQLAILGMYWSVQKLRLEVVRYMNENKDRFAHFTGQWEVYLKNMLKMSTFGDHLTLQSIADIFSVNIHIFTPNGVQYCLLTPSNSEAMATINLGYFPEGQGDHYVSLHHNNDATLSSQLDNESESSYNGNNNILPINPESSTDSNNMIHPKEHANDSNSTYDDDNISLPIDPKSSTDVHNLHIFTNGDNDPNSPADGNDMTLPIDAESSTDGNILTLSKKNGNDANTPHDEIAMTAPISLENISIFQSDANKVSLPHGRNNSTLPLTNDIDMSDWGLPFEITVLIISYCTSVDVSSMQRLRCVCKTFNNAVIASRTKPHALHIDPDVLYALGMSPSLGQFSISVCRLLKCAGAHSGLILHLRSIFKHPRWNHAWLLLLKGALPGWYIISRVYWRK